MLISVKNRILVFLFFVLFLFIQNNYASSVVGDSIFVPKTSVSPVIDGLSNDDCWKLAAWNPMPYVWIPYGANVPAADFTGRFKVLWNDEDDLLYLLFEITDDKFVNGYVASENNSNYYLFDVVEIFIDENHSGGQHETTNNAFAYHITGGNTNSEYDVMDVWGSLKKNYKDHFVLKRGKNGNVYTWEFSMVVLKDSYVPGANIGDNMGDLVSGKIMGFSAAYCDNDNSAVNPVRENFIASKYQTQANSNESYKNASIFGVMKLIDEPTNPALSTEQIKNADNEYSLFPNPVTESAELSFTDNYSGPVSIKIYNSIGSLIYESSYDKSSGSFRQTIDFSHARPGLYFLKVDEGTEKHFIKFIKSE